MNVSIVVPLQGRVLKVVPLLGLRKFDPNHDERGRFAETSGVAGDKERPKGKGFDQTKKTGVKFVDNQGRNTQMLKVAGGGNINTDVFHASVFNADNEGMVRVVWNANDGSLNFPNAGMHDADHGNFSPDVTPGQDPDLHQVRGTMDLHEAKVLWYDLKSESETISENSGATPQRVEGTLKRLMRAANASTFYVNGKKMKYDTAPIMEILGYKSAQDWLRKFNENHDEHGRFAASDEDPVEMAVLDALDNENGSLRAAYDNASSYAAARGVTVEQFRTHLREQRGYYREADDRRTKDRTGKAHKHTPLRKRTLPVIQAQANMEHAIAKFLKKTGDRLASRVRGYEKVNKLAQPEPELMFMEGLPGVPVWLMKYNENHDEKGRFAESDSVVITDTSREVSGFKLYNISFGSNTLKLQTHQWPDGALSVSILNETEGADKFDRVPIGVKGVRQILSRLKQDYPTATSIRGLRETGMGVGHFGQVSIKASKEPDGMTQEEILALLEQLWNESEKVHKAGTPAAKKLLDLLLPIDWSPLLDEIEPYMDEIAIAGGVEALGGLNITDTDIISGVNEAAANWAAMRAAEMVGMKRLPNGNLVVNPNAKWAISETTRDDIAELVTNAFEASTSIKELASAIQEAGTFSPARAKMIAETEGRRASTQGNLEGWKQSGVVKSLTWLLSNDHDKDDICDELADGSPYELGEEPDCPAHPNCFCVLSVAELIED